MKHSSLIAAGIATPISFALGDLYTANLLHLEGTSLENLTTAATTLPAYIADGGVFSAEPIALCMGAICTSAVWLAYSRYVMNNFATRKGEEHGSSRWATVKEMRALGDKANSDNNIILTQNCRLALVPKKRGGTSAMNRNIMVVGGSGTGKTRYYVKPNLLQANASFFVTDPKGTLFDEMKDFLAAQGYRTVVFNTIDMEKSNHYNPFAYINKETDIASIVTCLMDNTQGDENASREPFWDNAERLLYLALISYLRDHCPESDLNMDGLLTLLSLADAREEDENFKSPLDVLFDELETGMRYERVGNARAFDAESRSFDANDGEYRWVRVAEPAPKDDQALTSYKQFRVACGKTAKNILISCHVRMKPFGLASVRHLLSHDEMQLDHLGDAGQKTAIFAIMSDTDPTYNFLFTTMMWQAIDVLCDTARTRFGEALPTPVHLVFDEFANIGKLPNFDKTISTIRSRNLSCSIIVQSFSQLDKNYGEESANTIKENCATTLFLGGKSLKTNKELSELIGKETVALTTINDSHGQGSSTTRNRQLTERDLMQASEIGRLPRDEALVLVSGEFPMRDKKYNLEGHPRYDELIANMKRK
jgi:type IV secretion system protein VirD4